MIRLVKFLFILSNLLVYLSIDYLIGSNGAFIFRVLVHSMSFSMLVYVFGGLEKKENFSMNEILLSFGLSFIISLAFLLIYVAVFSVPIGYYYLLGTAVYSLLVAPFLIQYLYYWYFYRNNPQKALVIGEGNSWERIVKELMLHSLGRIVSIDFCSSDDILSGKFADVRSGKWNRIIAISPTDILYRKAKERGLILVSAGRYAEKHLTKIPLELIRCNEDHYVMSFEDIGVDPMVRLLDIFFSLLIILAASPFLLLSVIWITLIDRLPVLYRQERRGYRSNKIMIYKLTTMKLDHITGEYRVTSIGRVLRVLRLNEVPQLLNVVRGQMSLVGPRPDIELTYDFCLARIPYYHYRTNVLPGITGHAQVHYRYVDSLDVDTFSERLSYDLYYVKNYSIYLYLITLMKTVGSVLLLKGK